MDSLERHPATTPAHPAIRCGGCADARQRHAALRHPRDADPPRAELRRPRALRTSVAASAPPVPSPCSEQLRARGHAPPGGPRSVPARWHHAGRRWLWDGPASSPSGAHPAPVRFGLRQGPGGTRGCRGGHGSSGLRRLRPGSDGHDREHAGPSSPGGELPAMVLAAPDRTAGAGDRPVRSERRRRGHQMGADGGRRRPRTRYARRALPGGRRRERCGATRPGRGGACRRHVPRRAVHVIKEDLVERDPLAGLAVRLRNRLARLPLAAPLLLRLSAFLRSRFG